MKRLVYLIFIVPAILISCGETEEMPIDGTMSLVLVQDGVEGGDELILSVELRNEAGDRLTNTTGSEVTASISFTGDVAAADFEEFPTTVSIPKNAKKAEVTIRLADDARFEGDEKATITIFEGVGVELGTRSVPVVLGDNDSVDPDPDQYGEPFQVPEVTDMVVYEVNTRAFPGFNLKGVTGRLDVIEEMGVNVIWLMPIYPIGTTRSVNSPYSISDYRAVNPEFGTLDDLRDLVDGAHARGMAVILDWVANHTSWDNPWIDNLGWYTRDARGNIVIPAGTNWQDVADLNFNNESMQDAMISAMRYWVFAANIDGFRCDAADFVPKSFWEKALADLNSIPGRELILLAEGARDDHFEAGFQMNYAWDFYGTLKNVYGSQQMSASNVFTTNTSEYSGIPVGKHLLRFTTNHDESAWDATPVTLFGGLTGSMSAFVIASYLNGVPLIYGSQEIGLSSTLSFFNTTSLNWSQNRNILLEYIKLMKFYRENSTIRTGEITSYPNQDIVVFRKESITDEVLVLVNTRSSQKTWTVPAGLASSAWTDALDNAPVTLDASVTLDAYKYLVLTR